MTVLGVRKSWTQIQKVSRVDAVKPLGLNPGDRGHMVVDNTEVTTQGVKERRRGGHAMELVVVDGGRIAAAVLDPEPDLAGDALLHRPPRVGLKRIDSEPVPNDGRQSGNDTSILGVDILRFQMVCCSIRRMVRGNADDTANHIDAVSRQPFQYPRPQPPDESHGKHAPLIRARSGHDRDELVGIEESAAPLLIRRSRLPNGSERIRDTYHAEHRLDVFQRPQLGAGARPSGFTPAVFHESEVALDFTLGNGDHGPLTEYLLEAIQRGPCPHSGIQARAETGLLGETELNSVGDGCARGERQRTRIPNVGQPMLDKDIDSVS